MAAREWVRVDESAKEMLRRVSLERPCLVTVPPLHRLPLRPGNVLEIVGPSPSAKSQIFLQSISWNATIEHSGEQVEATNIMNVVGKSLSLQSVTETVVQELLKLLHVQPVIVVATKTTILRGKRNYFGSSFSLNDGAGDGFYHECMPSAWQSLVTQRILLQVTDDAVGSNQSHSPTFMAKWLLPSLNYLEKFVVRDSGISLVD